MIMMDVFKISQQYLKDIDIKSIKFKTEIEEEKRCLARLWGDGSLGDGQCERSIKSGCLCKKHSESSQRMNGIWWLGLITEGRPEEVVHQIRGNHKWSKDKFGNDYIIECKEKVEEVVKEEKVKRPRGRPKGSKNKK